MSIELVAHYAIAFCLIVGAAFILVGAIGLLRFSDPMARLHAPTKVGTLGVGALLLGSMIHSDIFGEGWSMHEFLIMAKVSLHSRSCSTPPDPPNDKTWSTLETPDEKQKGPEQQA